MALEREERGEVGDKQQLLTLLMDSVISIAKLVLGFWTLLGRVWWAGDQGSLQVASTLASRVSVTHTANTGSVRTLTLGRNGKSNQGSRHFKKIFIYLSLAALHLRCCAWAFSSCGKQGLPSSCDARASRLSGFSGCGAQAVGHTSVSSCDTQA